MPTSEKDATYWRTRAQKARDKATGLLQPGMRDTLMNKAETYERRAVLAERTAKRLLVPGRSQRD